MRIDVLTIFPRLIDGFASESLLGRARRTGLLDLRVHDIREQATDVHRSVDDTPFGGGAGMVMRPEPIFATVERHDPPRPLVLLGPGGRTLDQGLARELASSGGFSLLCGRYEGVDQRVGDHLVDMELSVGDYVLNGGEVAALVVLEAVARLVPGMMGNEHSGLEESFSEGLLEYPQFTRPADFRGWAVPEVLRSGDHRRVQRWRRAMAIRRTLEQRPDLLAARGGLSEAERELLEEFPQEDASRPSAARGGFCGQWRQAVSPSASCSLTSSFRVRPPARQPAADPEHPKQRARHPRRPDEVHRRDRPGEPPRRRSRLRGR
ncbi:MAG: tRNA (guanosine(37)-N1)-methyltransferase TrmD [Microthrixaceae bacterium]